MKECSGPKWVFHLLLFIEKQNTCLKSGPIREVGVTMQLRADTERRGEEGGVIQLMGKRNKKKFVPS